jgi:hypothetical protein
MEHPRQGEDFPRGHNPPVLYTGELLGSSTVWSIATRLGDYSSGVSPWLLGDV